MIAVALLAISWAAQQPSPPAPPAEQPAAAAQPAAPTSGPEQPLPFSHKHHAGTLGLPCETCHVQSRSGETLSIPQAATCMKCHQSIATDKPAIQKLAETAKSNSTIRWTRIYELPSFVTFSHKTHLDHGNTCQECHGAVATRDRLFKETDLSMKWCVDCHTTKKASTDCNTCHTLQQ